MSLSESVALSVTFHGVDGTDAIEQYVRQRADKLSVFARQIVACRVAVEAPHRKKHRGRHYRVRLDLATRGREVIVDRCPDAGRACEDLYAAIDQAFDHACRQLRDDAKRRLPDHKRATNARE